MPDPTLKPCPRCEGEAGYQRKPHVGWAAYCTVCQLSGQWFRTKEEAAVWWNERKAEQPEPEPTHAAKDEPPHVCPYEGTTAGRYGGIPVSCGVDGWLCNRCQQDRADARTRALVRALIHGSPSDLSNAAREGIANSILRQEGLL